MTNTPNPTPPTPPQDSGEKATPGCNLSSGWLQCPRDAYQAALIEKLARALEEIGRERRPGDGFKTAFDAADYFQRIAHEALQAYEDSKRK